MGLLQKFFILPSPHFIPDSRGLIAALLAALLFGSTPVLAEEAAATVEAPLSEPVHEEKAKSDITARSQAALTRIDLLRAELEKLGDSEDEAAAVGSLETRVDELFPEGQSIEDLAVSQTVMDDIAIHSRTVTTQAGSLIDRLTDHAESLENLKREVRDLTAQWKLIQADAGALPEALQARIREILKQAGEISEQSNRKLNRVIELQDAAMGIRNLITPIAERIDTYGKSQQTRMFEKNAVPIWSLTTEHISESSERSTRQFSRRFQRDFVAWLESSEASIGGHLFLLPLLVFLLFRLKRVAETTSQALARPLATSILIWMLLGIVIYAGAPQAVRLVYVVAAMLVATVVLLEFLPRTMRRGVLVFVGIALVHEFFQSQPVIEHLPRVGYLLLSPALMVLAWFSRSRNTTEAFLEWGAPRVLISTAVNAAVISMAIATGANTLGYVVLAKFLTQGVVDSTAVFLILFAGFSSISEIVQMVLRLPILDNFRSIASNRYRLQRVLRKPLVWISLLMWLWATLVAFGIADWVIGALQSVFQAEIAFGDVSLSLNGLFVFIFAVWLAVWTSRVVRAVLNQDVLPRLELPRGVPNTISMTAHYSIILIGLLLGVGYMGLDLSNLAFVVGALGVGIGFGLQNVVNNFVSGLILIFEAPIQVGDTVEVGSLMGQVVQIGIRTSRVRTYSGSEVIVPNGDLVSNQVVNWTLSDRRRRLELGVGVAYGSDTDKVTEILRGVLEADEHVLDDPAPLIVFSEFGDSALNFRIFAWIGDFDIGFGTTHRLNSAINNALAEAGINIPFPQRDVHLITPPEPDPPAQSA